jgi:hypothetical protein
LFLAGFVVADRFVFIVSIVVFGNVLNLRDVFRCV